MEMNKDEALKVIAKTSYEVYRNRNPIEDYKKIMEAFKVVDIPFPKMQKGLTFVHITNINRIRKIKPSLYNLKEKVLGIYTPVYRFIYVNLPVLSYWEDVDGFIKNYSDTIAHEVLHDTLMNDVGGLDYDQQHFIIDKLGF